MSDTKRPDLRVLEFKPPERDEDEAPDNEWANGVLDTAKDNVAKLTAEGEHITGIAIAYSTHEGTTGCRFLGSDYVRLAGATSGLLHRLNHEGE